MTRLVAGDIVNGKATYNEIKTPKLRECKECGRVFDLLSTEDASEWAYGHACKETK